MNICPRCYETLHYIFDGKIHRCQLLGNSGCNCIHRNWFSGLGTPSRTSLLDFTVHGMSGHVSWSLTSLFSTNITISETKGQECRASNFIYHCQLKSRLLSSSLHGCLVGWKCTEIKGNFLPPVCALPQWYVCQISVVQTVSLKCLMEFMPSMDIKMSLADSLLMQVSDNCLR